MNTRTSLALIAADLDEPFSRAELSDDALTAAIWTTARFDKTFPGWQLYRRIIAGYEMLDRDLLAWAIGCAHQLARAKTRGGHDYLRSDARGPWIALAAADALCGVIYWRFPVHADKRGYVRGVRLQTYAKIRGPLTACMVRGLESFRSELHYQYFRVRKAQIDDSACKLLSKEGLSWRDYPHGVSNPMLRVAGGNGCTYTMPAPLHD